jgi:hypothetical protein
MLVVRAGMTRIAARSPNPMHAFAVFAVNDHLEYLLQEAAERRRVQRTRPTLRTRFAAAIEAFRTATPVGGIPRPTYPQPR